MKRRIFKAFCCIFIAFLFLSGATLAAEDDLIEQTLNKQYIASGADKLPSELPEGTEDVLSEGGVESPSPDDIAAFDIGGFLKGIFDYALDIIKSPLSLLTGCLAVLLICALFEAFGNAQDSSLSSVLGTVSTLAVCGVIISPIISCVSLASNVIKAMGDFMLCFIPVYTAVVAASGSPTAAIGYNTALFSLAQIISAVTADLLLPFIGIFLAVSVAGSVSGQFKIASLTETVKKVVVFTLTLLVTIFVGLFTMQNMVAVSADSLSLKTAKFLSGSFVPVVGGALSDALSSVLGCLGVIKTSVGGYGVLVAFATFLPPIITVLFFMLAIKLAGTVSEFLGVSVIPGLMTAAYDAMSVLLAFLICYGVLMIVTTTIMLTIG